MEKYRSLLLHDKIAFIKQCHDQGFLERIHYFELFSDNDLTIVYELLKKELPYSKDFFESIIFHHHYDLEAMKKVIDHKYVPKSIFYLLAKSGYDYIKVLILSHKNTPMELLDTLYFYGNETDKELIKSNSNYQTLAKRILNKIN